MNKLTDSQYKFFADYIEKELGIIYTPSNYYQLEKRLVDICRNLEMDDLGKLWDITQTQGIKGHLKQLLLDLATNNETSFFRDNKMYKAVRTSLVPDWLVDRGVAPFFRVWSVASSFGQEPYSMAIMFDEMKAKDSSIPRLDLFASDISEKALERAKAGKYTQLEVQRGLSAPRMVKYFTKKEDEFWHVNPEIKSSVSFGKVNLLDIFGVNGKFDLILCRNVLIYQNEERKKEIVKNLASYLNPGGYFIMGAAESLIGISDEFDQVFHEGAIYYKKKG